MKQLPTHLFAQCHEISCVFFWTASLKVRDSHEKSETNTKNLKLKLKMLDKHQKCRINTKNVRLTLKERDFHGKFGTNAENSGQTLKILN